MLASPLLDEAYPVGVGLRRATTTPDLRRPRSTDGPVSRISSFLEVVPHPSDAPTHMRTHVAADVEHARAWQKSSQRTAHSPTPHRQSLTTAGSQRTAHSPPAPTIPRHGRPQTPLLDANEFDEAAPQLTVPRLTATAPVAAANANVVTQSPLHYTTQVRALLVGLLMSTACAIIALYYALKVVARHLHLGCISASSSLHLGCISAAPRLHHGCTSAAPWLHLGCTSVTSR